MYVRNLYSIISNIHNSSENDELINCKQTKFVTIVPFFKQSYCLLDELSKIARAMFYCLKKMKLQAAQQICKNFTVHDDSCRLSTC